MTSSTLVEISVKGAWSTVPALQVGGALVVLGGTWLKVASVHDEPWLEGELEDPGGCIRELRRHGVGGRQPDIFTFAQKLPAVAPKYRYPLEWDNIAAVPSSSYAGWWTRVPRETRKNVRRAEKRGVVVTVRALDDDLVRSIVDVNNDSPTRQRAFFHHYGKTFEQVKKDQSTFLQRSEFICASVGDELIGFLKLVCCNQSGTLIQLVTKISHADKRPANALIAKAVERCEEKALPYLVFGKYRYGNQPRTNLLEFKRRNGFEEILVPRYFVPLTRKGRLAMKLTLHRDRVAMLPQSAIALGRLARARLHGLSMRSTVSSFSETGSGAS